MAERFLKENAIDEETITTIPNLKKIRKVAVTIKLRSMAAIYNIALNLQPQMQKELHITQLIYINADTIDIRFRNDEKRFDVEGAYNIRYQLIKKRIDKVHVKDTGERWPLNTKAISNIYRRKIY